MKPFSITEITNVIKDILEGAVGKVSVEGEISNFRKQSSGHYYFTLKDASAQLSVVMFRHEALYLNFVPQDGQCVIADGEITVYPPRGNYQLRASALHVKGKGSLQEQFEALKRKLSLEGLFDQERKKSLPFFLSKVGVITSPSGAALHDFVQILQRRCPRIHIQVYGAKVQGEGAAQEIIQALKEFNRRKEVDIIVLARGGGSLEDLWAFNEEPLVRAIAASKIPTISAVGHEIDFTLSDFVADLRAPTPSAAAEILSCSDEEWKNKIAGLKEKLLRGVLDQIKNLQQKHQQLASSYVFREPKKMVEQWMQRVGDIQQNLSTHAQHALEIEKGKFNVLLKSWEAASPRFQLEKFRQVLKEKSSQLRLLSPQHTLNRGYAIVFDQKQNVIKKQKDAIRANDLTLRLSDGDLPMSIKKTK